MSTLQSLSRTTKRARRQRVGRGGKRGTFSGRGTKGQKARSGRKMRPELRDTIKKIPKLRGYRVRIYRTKPIPVSLKDIERLFPADATVGVKELVEKGLVNVRRAKEQGVKVLAGGELTRAIHLNQVSVSEAVRAIITKAGGTVTEIVKKAVPEKQTPKKVKSREQRAVKASVAKKAPAKKVASKKSAPKKK